MFHRFYDTGPGPREGDSHGLCGFRRFGRELRLAFRHLQAQRYANAERHGRKALHLAIGMSPVLIVLALVVLGLSFSTPAQAQPEWTPNPTEYLAPEPCLHCMYLPLIDSGKVTSSLPPVTPTAPGVPITAVPTATPSPTPTSTPVPPGTPFPVTPDPNILVIEYFHWTFQSPDTLLASMTVCNYSSYDRIIAPFSDVVHEDDFTWSWQAWQDETYLVPAGDCIYPSTVLLQKSEHGRAVEVSVYF